MIYTLTLNPAVDHELQVDQFEFDAVSRAVNSRIDCGGKGFNVSRMLRNLNTASIAMGFVGGKNGERLEQMLQSLGIDTHFNKIEGETRTNVSIVKAGESKHIKVNEPGPTIQSFEISALLESVKKSVQAGDWWVLAGSLPPGVDVSIYADLTRLIEGAGAHVILDTSGEALKLGCDAKPSVIKPNLEEAIQLLGLPADSDIETSEVASRILAMGPKNLIISMGKDGALLATESGLKQVKSPTIVERNPTGAGDSLVAGLVWGLSEGHPIDYALKCGIACGAATASCPGTELGSFESVNELLAKVED